MRCRSYIILVISLLSWSALTAQDKSNRGKEFWLGYGFNYSFFWETPVNAQELAIYISTEQAATVTVSILNTGFTQTLNIPANTVDASIIIPKSGPNDARILTDGLSNHGIHIVSDVPVAVYAHQYATMVSGATMLMPVETWGYSYYSINYYQTTSQSSPADWYSWFHVIATEDNTRVEITPSDSTRNGWLPYQTYTVNLNKGEIYNVFGKAIFDGNPAHASKDLTGSKLISVPGADGNCHPIGVFSGSGGIRLCRGDGGEFVHQQVFPAQAWGTRYLTYHTINNTNTDITETNRNIYRICVQDPTTIVKKNGVPMTGLIKNFYYEYMDSTGGDYIEADKPIQVAQYMTNKNQCWNFPTTSPSPPSYGDPEMFYISPIEQGQKSVLFYVSRKSSIDYVYANIHLPTVAVSSLKVDGSPVPAGQIIPHPHLPSYSVALVRFTGPAAQHTITADSAFTSTVYGLGNYESYGYNVGTLINNLNNYSAIHNTLNQTPVTDTFTCPKTPFRLYAKLAFPANSITWNLSQVPGLNPGVDSVQNNPVPLYSELINGRTYYTYTLQHDFTLPAAGTYYIPVSYSASVIQNCNQTEYATVKVVVKPGPQPDFTYQNLCFRDTVRFTGAQIGNAYAITGYLWTFPDGSTQTTANAKKLFSTTGNFNINLKLLATNGCVGDTTKQITLSTGTIPPLSFNFTGTPCTDSTLQFRSSLNPDPNNAATWYWDFGDGQQATFPNNNVTTHTYSAAATNITVKHLVTFTTGCSPDTVRLVIPFIYGNPVAEFSWSGDTLCVGKNIQFDSQLSGIAGWNWSFSPGSGIQTPPFNYAFQSAGAHAVSLSVKDIHGCGSLPVAQTITIHPDPVIDAGPDQYISSGSSASLNPVITNPSNYSFLWTPSTYLNASNILNPVSTPDIQPVTYTVTATDNTTHCSGSDQVVIVPVIKLFIPTGFTPNHDGINDTWNIPGLALYPQAQVSIYDRWGQKIYDRKNYIQQPWDGTFRGTRQPVGTYVYIIHVNDAKQQVLKGTFNLVQ